MNPDNFGRSEPVDDIAEGLSVPNTRFDFLDSGSFLCQKGFARFLWSVARYTNVVGEPRVDASQLRVNGRRSKPRIEGYVDQSW